jgi:site-specific DNA-methyltransferase (adenine-specific)/site-specific DNA-methyltransferase (cytosine-N4-specific)
VAQLKLNLGREVELRVFNGDCAKVLPELEANLIQCCVTSPPYWGLRDYDHPDQIGAEASPDLYVKNLVLVFREVRRTLRDDGTLWSQCGRRQHEEAHTKAKL